jgi:hypothetical protein
VPTDSVEVWPFAVPLLSGPLATVCPPSVNVTVPVGVPLPLTGVTPAVKTTVWPKVAGFGVAETRFVRVDGPFTTTSTGFDVLGPKVLLPLYTATSRWAPTARAVVCKPAVPFVSGTVPPLMADPLSMKVTVPVADAGVTTALMITGVPEFTEEGPAVRFMDVGVGGAVPIVPENGAVAIWRGLEES